MQAKYFDGKNSKPHIVLVKEIPGGFQIVSFDNSSEISRFWELADIRTESFATGQKILLSYGDFPHERLELTGEEAQHFMSAVLSNESPIKSYQHKITRANPVTLVLGSLTVLALVIYSYIFHISPYVGAQAVKLIPKAAEAKVGEVMYENMAFSMDIDDEKSALLLDFFKACGFKSEYDIRFDYSESDMVNAFAVPGGQIVVFEGLIRETQNWDELAALMGHELAHVNLRHSFKQLTRSITSYLLLSVLTGDVAGASSVVLENASQIHEMANSRAHEKEADMFGLTYLKESKIRPQAMVDLFTRFEELTDTDVDEKVEKSIEYFSTHPLTNKRIEYLREVIASDSSFDYEPKSFPEAEEIWCALKENTEKSTSTKLIEKIAEKVKEKLEKKDEE